MDRWAYSGLVALTYIAVGDNHFFGMNLVDGATVDVGEWPHRAVQAALEQGVIAAVADSTLDSQTDVIDGGSA